MNVLTDQQIYDRLGKIKGLPTCSQWAQGLRRLYLRADHQGSHTLRSPEGRVLQDSQREQRRSPGVFG